MLTIRALSEETRRHLKPVETRPGIMYGSFKLKKKSCPLFRPILSALETPTYKLARLLVPILEPLTTDKYTVKYSFFQTGGVAMKL